ncbi:flagellar basal-body MS-ring/collar protein FliF [Asticcacaulis endophyticus]|uniref:Flagellar M-ring protein n=1 Tax=Asticcacaulis endophyticus TaxID=1395890 RepID=A0A918PQX9_9CAUL|nr:flagellar basal-body MS-ring/collar protein FliF [Asticcacaulis endophyticus]GGZ19721.1 flagellar M-ring protein [Asticcacaulis endophyticus]
MAAQGQTLNITQQGGGFLQRFGIGRLAAIVGVSIGIAAVLAAVMLHFAAQPQSLLFSNLDLKEASEITAALDQAGIKYSAKGDGSTIMVERDQVATARLMLAEKGMPTAASVGYEIFDNAPALGQTEFVQNLNDKRALEGELARTIRSLKGVTSARVHLVMPKRQLFEEDAAQPTASVVVGLSGRQLTGDEVRSIRNLVASAVPNLKPSNITLVDDKNRLLAAGGEDDPALGAAGAERKNEVEETLRKRIKDIVEGVVGVGAARVTVTAELDTTTTTRKQEQYDPDGQVVRSTKTSETNDSSSQPDPNGVTTAAANIPGGQEANGAATATNSSGATEETTNFEISNTTTTEVTAPGQVKKLAVAVVVDGVLTPPAGGQGAPAYAPRSAEDMAKIEELVRAAVGINAERGDVISVANVRFSRDPGEIAEGTGAAGGMFDFDKNDIMRAIEMLILVVVAVLIIFFVARPLMKFINGTAGPGGAAGLPNNFTVALTPEQAAMLPEAQQAALAAQAGGLALPGAETSSIDMAKIEGQVKASSVKKVSEFVERHPDESVSILRSWLHES